MNNFQTSYWENIFSEKIEKLVGSQDPAHDLQHFKRVVKTAKELSAKENAKIEVVLPAAWLHDIVIIPKNSPLRAQASGMSASKACELLKEINYPKEYLKEISHAIEAHSFSAKIETKTLEAKIVQDADRLDALGAVGLARCFITAGLLKRPIYSAIDPFCLEREPDDGLYIIDHFYKKLFFIAETLKTNAGKEEGLKRAKFMRSYLKKLQSEI